MELICRPLVNGIMACWEKVEDAASYTVTLYINEQVISTRINDRNEMYATFTGLAAIDGETVGLFKSLEGKVLRTMHIVGGGGSYRPQSTYTGMDYYVQVQAENRKGEVIASSNKKKCTVKEF